MMHSMHTPTMSISLQMPAYSKSVLCLTGQYVPFRPSQRDQILRNGSDSVTAVSSIADVCDVI